MIVNSTRFGKIEVNDEQIITLPNGLPGFLNETQFVLFPYEIDSPFWFFQSLHDVNLSFMMVDPFYFFPNYEFHLDDVAAEEMKISSNNPPAIYNIITVPSRVEEMTANLLAPVIINKKDRLAMQIVLDKTAYTTKHRLFPDAGNNTSEGGR